MDQKNQKLISSKIGLYSQIFPLTFIYLISSKYLAFPFMVYYKNKSLLLVLLQFWARTCKLVFC